MNKILAGNVKETDFSSIQDENHPWAVFEANHRMMLELKEYNRRDYNRMQFFLNNPMVIKITKAKKSEKVFVTTRLARFLKSNGYEIRNK